MTNRASIQSWAGALLAGVLLLVFLTLRPLSATEAETEAPPCFGGHGLWIESYWLYGVRKGFGWRDSPYRGWLKKRKSHWKAPKPMTSEDADSLIARCRKLGIENLYFKVGSLDKKGAFPLWPLDVNLSDIDEARRDDYKKARSYFTALTVKIRKELPGVRVLAWIGARLERWDMGKEEKVEKALETSRRVLESWDFDGVHYNFEPVMRGDERLLRFLEKARKKLTRGAFISFAGTEISPLSYLPIAGKYIWDGSSFAAVARRVDQVAFMTYDTGLPLDGLYRDFLMNQVKEAIYSRLQRSMPLPQEGVCSARKRLMLMLVEEAR